MSRALVASFFVGKVELIAGKQFRLLDGLLVIEPIQVIIVIRIRSNDFTVVARETTSFRIGG